MLVCILIPFGVHYYMENYFNKDIGLIGSVNIGRLPVLAGEVHVIFLSSIFLVNSHVDSIAVVSDVQRCTCVPINENTCRGGGFVEPQPAIDTHG